MSENRIHASGIKHRPSLPIIGCLILFTVVLGTTRLGYIPVPTAAQHATTMHLPTIIASLLEGWPVGMVIGAVFGVTSMYMAGAPMVQDPLVALVPRMLVGITPFFVYIWMKDRNEIVRLSLAAIVGTATNTVLFLSMAVAMEYLSFTTAVHIAWIHGIPEAIVAVLIVVPSVLLLRRLKAVLERLFGHH